MSTDKSKKPRDLDVADNLKAARKLLKTARETRLGDEANTLIERAEKHIKAAERDVRDTAADEWIHGR